MRRRTAPGTALGGRGLLCYIHQTEHALRAVRRCSMPSPFPGMDPYLESPQLWPTFHSPLVTAIAEVLNAALPRAYVARESPRLYVLGATQSYDPDVSVKKRTTKGSRKKIQERRPCRLH